jgi:hypothetical protein
VEGISEKGKGIREPEFNWAQSVAGPTWKRSSCAGGPWAGLGANWAGLVWQGREGKLGSTSTLGWFLYQGGAGQPPGARRKPSRRRAVQRWCSKLVRLTARAAGRPAALVHGACAVNPLRERACIGWASGGWIR